MTEKAFFSFVAFIGGPFLFLPSLEEAASGRGHHWKGERKREREREREDRKPFEGPESKATLRINPRDRGEINSWEGMKRTGAGTLQPCIAEGAYKSGERSVGRKATLMQYAADGKTHGTSVAQGRKNGGKRKKVKQSIL